MPRWGTVVSLRRPGAASAGAALPPANIRWRPSGTGRFIATSAAIPLLDFADTFSRAPHSEHLPILPV